MAHSRDSSFADAYYTSSPTREDVVDDYADHLVHYAQQQQQPQALRQQTTLAQIHIPSFRSFASSIPVPSPKARERKPAPFQLSTRSPRAASFSLAERASPRLAEPTSRPLSLDSPLLQQSNGLAGTVSPPQAGHGDRYGHNKQGQTAPC
ncbi:hypothetical protein LTR48_006993 [Friedmanniomyces endolithicus]|nr:hypothetical protein LTR48_006993 [Friedmanniomyces endolithicus]